MGARKLKPGTIEYRKGARRVFGVLFAVFGFLLLAFLVLTMYEVQQPAWIWWMSLLSMYGGAWYAVSASDFDKSPDERREYHRKAMKQSAFVALLGAIGSVFLFLLDPIYSLGTAALAALGLLGIAWHWMRKP